MLKTLSVASPWGVLHWVKRSNIFSQILLRLNRLRKVYWSWGFGPCTGGQIQCVFKEKGGGCNKISNFQPEGLGVRWSSTFRHPSRRRVEPCLSDICHTRQERGKSFPKHLINLWQAVVWWIPAGGWVGRSSSGGPRVSLSSCPGVWWKAMAVYHLPGRRRGGGGRGAANAGIKSSHKPL